jgi:hypothetical protein
VDNCSSCGAGPDAACLPGDATLDVARVHQHTLARRKGVWEIIESSDAPAEARALEDVANRIGIDMPHVVKPPVLAVVLESIVRK